jgi:hypothetical protein
VVHGQRAALAHALGVAGEDQRHLDLDLLGQADAREVHVHRALAEGVPLDLLHQAGLACR